MKAGDPETATDRNNNNMVVAAQPLAEFNDWGNIASYRREVDRGLLFGLGNRVRFLASVQVVPTAQRTSAALQVFVGQDLETVRLRKQWETVFWCDSRQR